MKVALVTASSAGLGTAIAKSLAPNMRVVNNYWSNAERAELIQKEMGIIAGSDKLVSDTIDTMGRLDVVVSNGGWTRIRKLDDLDQNVDENDWDQCFNINVKSHLFLLHAARKYLDETQGSFVTVASVAGVKPSGSSIVLPLPLYPPGHLHY
ncbi:hypothetical protein N7508_004544 [Penicillium antarcticum]|uniref:uncharacterized protein n=1 Tax=Penicillium antarcticum TaxID=416450 RepID=UPI00238DED66|nr:uncharacterized protein N7508_004544 [Penicillium antarcticum]KAJ5309165.1 hypothetical protein N7508_004544 [Penicillium antarcticum]